MILIIITLYNYNDDNNVLYNNNKIKIKTI